MARRVFFSFHYQMDIWRVNQIRMAHIVEGTAAAGWHDASIWEEAKRMGDDAVHGLINRGLEGTTVTAVLIGSQTANRKYVKYEIDQSIARGNGILGIYIHDLKDQRGLPSPKEKIPLIGLHGRAIAKNCPRLTGLIIGRCIWDTNISVNGSKTQLEPQVIRLFACTTFYQGRTKQPRPGPYRGNPDLSFIVELDGAEVGSLTLCKPQVIRSLTTDDHN